MATTVAGSDREELLAREEGEEHPGLIPWGKNFTRSSWCSSVCWRLSDLRRRGDLERAKEKEGVREEEEDPGKLMGASGRSGAYRGQLIDGSEIRTGVGEDGEMSQLHCKEMKLNAGVRLRRCSEACGQGQRSGGGTECGEENVADGGVLGGAVMPKAFRREGSSAGPTGSIGRCARARGAVRRRERGKGAWSGEGSEGEQGRW